MHSLCATRPRASWGRSCELLALEWEYVDLERQTAHLPNTKNGDARTVPLSKRAVAILKSLPRPEVDNAGDDEEVVQRSGAVFATTALALRKCFRAPLSVHRRSTLSIARKPREGQ